MMALFNVVLFVLFGSVVPASAQSEGGGMTADVWAIIGVGVVLLGVILATWHASRTDNREAHTKIGKNIDRVEGKLKADINRVEEKLKTDINKVEGKLKADINRVEGKLKADIDRVEENLRADARESEKRLNDNINKVHGDVRLLLDHALREKSDGSAQDRP